MPDSYILLLRCDSCSFLDQRGDTVVLAYDLWYSPRYTHVDDPADNFTISRSTFIQSATLLTALHPLPGKLLLVLLVASVSVSSGCATVHTRLGNSNYSGELYPATKQTTDWVSDSDIPLIGRAVMILDYPFSLVSDTILLPFDATLG